MQKLQIKHQAGSGLIQELAKRVYFSPMATFREVISNAIDEGSKKIHIRLSAKQIIFEDFGNGITDVKKFAIYGESVKSDNRSTEIIGEKGLGKLSLLMLNEDKVQFLTNNGKDGMSILMNEVYFDIVKGKPDAFLEHQGTKIIVEKPTFVPTQDELTKYISKTFGLWVKKGIEILINDEKVEPFKHIDANEKRIIRNVTGNIEEDPRGNGTLDLYIKHVYVTTILVDPSYLYSGWINCNKLTPTTSRDDVVKDDDFRKTVNTIKEYVRQFPEKQPKDSSNEEKMLAMQIGKMFELFMETNDIKVKGESGRKTKKSQMIEIPVGSESIMIERKETEETDEEKTEEKEAGEPEVKETDEKIEDRRIQHLNKNKYGIITVIQEYGDVKAPIFFYAPNVIVINKTNSLYPFMTKPKSNFGPLYFRILPWLSRAFADLEAHIKGSYKNLTTSEIIQRRDEEADRSIKWYLQQQKVI